MSVRRGFFCLPVFGAAVALHADQPLFRYEGNEIPTTSNGWLGSFCTPPCAAFIEAGHLVFRWPGAGDRVSIGRFFDPPPSLWVEWRFRSNELKPANFDDCDGNIIITYGTIVDVVFLFGNAAVSFSGDNVVVGLDPAEFHTYRWESPDGIYHRVSVDGFSFFENLDEGCCESTKVQFGGDGGCPPFSGETINEWDFVRLGTLASGEQMVVTDPPAGVLNPALYTGLDRFTVTYDSANYAYIDDITVEVTGGIAPQVRQTRRLDNGAPEVLEIVLDRPIPLGHTTRFIFNDPGAPGAGNVVEYTLDYTAGCCLSDGTCRMETDSACAALSGTYLGDNFACAGDPDGDGIDSYCGDQCPNDPAKTDPGICGCHVSDTADADGDTVPDCNDQCPGVSDALFAPGCIPAIPALSHWGAVILTLTLLTAAKLRRLGSLPHP